MSLQDLETALEISEQGFIKLDSESYHEVQSELMRRKMQPQDTPDSSSLQQPPPSMRRSNSDSNLMQSNTTRNTWPTPRGGTRSQTAPPGAAQDMSLQDLETALKICSNVMDSPLLGQGEHNPGEYAPARLRRSSKALARAKAWLERRGMEGLRRSGSEADVLVLTRPYSDLQATFPIRRPSGSIRSPDLMHAHFLNQSPLTGGVIDCHHLQRTESGSRLRPSTETVTMCGPKADVEDKGAEDKLECLQRQEEVKNGDDQPPTPSDSNRLQPFTPAVPLTMDQHPCILWQAGAGGQGQDGKRIEGVLSRSNRKMLPEGWDKGAGGSIVCMLKSATFAIEGKEPVFWVVRWHCLDQPLTCSWATVPDKGRAIPGKHYIESNGTVTFAKGENRASFTVPIVDDDGWEPIRDFVVQLRAVERGKGIIGKLDWTNCGIVDDDIYPSKVGRTNKEPMSQQEKAFRSCHNSDIYLTANEVPDYRLVWGYIMERFSTLYPTSLYGILVCILRGFYHVSMSLVLVVMIDFIWLDPAGVRTCRRGKEHA